MRCWVLGVLLAAVPLARAGEVPPLVSGTVVPILQSQADLIEPDAACLRGLVVEIDGRLVVILLPPNPGPTPGPTPPTPGPTPPTPQPIPDGTYKLGQFAKDAAVAYVTAITAAERAQTAAALATSWRSVAGAIAAGAITTLQEANDKLRESNRSMLREERIINAWLPWAGVVSKRLDELKIANVIEAATAFREIATGLEAIK